MKTPRFLICCLCLSFGLLLKQNARSQAPDHHFSSDFGFELSYPKNWTPNILGAVQPTSAKDLDAQVRYDPQKRAIACNQKVFFSRLGEPASYFVGGVEATDCLGKTPPLDPFMARTTALVRNSFSKLNSLERGEYVADGQKFWVLKAAGVSRRDPDGIVTVEYVATVLPQALLYWSVEAHGTTARSDFEHSRVQLKTGAQTELLPAGTNLSAVDLASPRQPAPARVAGENVVALDYAASHHFKSGLGFTFEVPQDLVIVDVKSLNTIIRAAADRRPLGSEESKSGACARGLLGAENLNSSKVLTIFTHRKDCIGLSTDDLSRVSLYALSELGSAAVVSHVETARSTIGSHALWVARSNIVPKNPADSNRFIAMAIFSTQDAIVEALLVAKTRAELDTLTNARIEFEDGAAGEIISDAVFAAN